MSDMSQQDLRGRTALVTGAARGLGRAYAHALAAHGADVAVLDIDLASFMQFAGEQAAMTAPSTAEEIRAMGARSIEIACDTTDASAVRAAVDDIVEQWGRLDIVVCNAGGGSGRPSQSRPSIMDLDEFDVVLRRNLHSTVHTCQAVAPIMRSQGYGKIITVASRAGLEPISDGGYAHYGTAKAAVVMYSRYLAQELGPEGITVNCIAPGSIATGRLAPLFERAGDALVDRIALRRVGTPQDCAGVVAFLAGPASDYLTGAVIPVDGGASR
jgi:3-oxoacyl-[acyl-carrier protein] reductase